MAGAERALGHPLSVSLGALYAQTDGLRDEYGYALVLPLHELISQNAFLRGEEYRDL